jgi:hypothetical protein
MAEWTKIQKTLVPLMVHKRGNKVKDCHTSDQRQDNILGNWKPPLLSKLADEIVSGIVCSAPTATVTSE